MMRSHYLVLRNRSRSTKASVCKALSIHVLAAAACGLAAPSSMALQYIYTPAGTTDQWGAGTNWDALPASATTTQLTFVGDTNTILPDGQSSTSNNNIAGNFLLNILDLQGTGGGSTASITISGNPLEFDDNGGLAPVINLNAAAGGSNLVYTVSNNLVLTDGVTFQTSAGLGNGTFRFTGDFTGAGTAEMVKQGPARLILTGNNTLPGGVDIGGGTLEINTGAQLGAASLTLGNANFGGALQVNGANVTIDNAVVGMDGNAGNPARLYGSSTIDFTGTFRCEEGNGVFDVQNSGLTILSGPVHTSDSGSNRNLRIAGTGNVLISGNVSNGTAGASLGSITYQGSGTLTMTGNNTHTGGRTIVASGTMVINNQAQLGGSTLEIGVSSGATMAPTLKIADLSPVSISNITYIPAGVAFPATIEAATPLEFSGQFSARTANALVNINNTELTTLSGAVMISESASNRNLRLAGSGNILISGNVTNGGSATAGSLTYQGSGTITLTGTNTHGGVDSTTAVSSGTMVITDATQLGTSTLVVGGSVAASTLNINGSNVTIPNTLRINGGTATPGNLNANTPLNFSGPVYVTTANGVLNINNSALTTMSGSVNLSNDTSSRTMIIGGSGNVLISGEINNGVVPAVGNLTYQGSATLTATGSNTYTGNTRVNSGTIVLGPHAHSPVLTGGGAILNGGVLVMDYTGGSSPKPTIVDGPNGLTANAAGGFQTGIARTTHSVNADKAIGWLDDGTSTFQLRYTHKGDANLDGKVTTVDFNELAGGFGGAGVWGSGDFNFDGTVDSLDFDHLIANYGKAPLAGSLPSPALGAVVPEPASLSILAMGALALASRRRRA